MNGKAKRRLQRGTSLVLCLMLLIGLLAPPGYAAAGEDPAEESTLAEESVPAEGDAPTEESTPAEGDAPTEESAPAEGDDPTEESTPAEGDAPTEESVPAEGDDPAEESVPAEGDAPTEESTPAEGDDPAEESTTAEGDDPNEEVDLTEEDSPEQKLEPYHEQTELLELLSERGPFSGDGTAESPYQITEEEDLRRMAELVNAGEEADAWFQLTADITLTGAWTPIGTADSRFRGVFDGNGKTVSGLSICSESAPAAGDYQGLFGWVSLGTIKDLTVTGSVYASGNYVGGIVGYSGGQLLDCVFGDENSVVSGGDYVGGVAGYHVYGYAYSVDSHSLENRAQVSGRNYVGGVYGYMYSDEDGASYENSGSVSGSQYVGGVTGYTYINFVNHNAKNTGNVTGATDVGGIVGYTKGASNYFGSYDAGTLSNSGAISGGSNVGGIAGTVSGRFCCATGSAITNTGTVTGSGENVGGVAGSFGQLSGYSLAYKFGGAVVNEGTVTGGSNAGGLFGRSDSTLVNGSNFNTSTIRLENTGTVSGTACVGGILGYGGGTIATARLGMTNAGAVTASGDYAGGILGRADGTLTVSTYALTNRAAVTAENNAGGIAGYTASTVTASNVVNQGDITARAENAGGLFGWTAGSVTLGTIAKQSGSVTAQLYAGGVTGVADGNISGSAFVNSGTVTASVDYAGGIAGMARGFDITLSNLAVTSGTVSAPANAGGILGCANGEITIKNSFSTIHVTATEGDDFKGALVGGMLMFDLYLSGCFSYVKDANGAVVDIPLSADEWMTTQENCYYLAAESGSDGARSAEDFRSGTVARELGAAWGQKLGTDEMPYPLSASHPAVYTLTVEQNSGLEGLSVRPDDTGAVYRAYGNMTYVNSGMVVTLKADGLAEADDLTFTPLDRVSEKAGAGHGVYTITAAAEDVTVTYEKAYKIAADTSWSEADELVVDSEADLIGLARLVNEGNDFAGKTITLGGDIALTASAWTPIGTQENPFRGTFAAGEKEDGGFYAISGFQVESALDGQALFGYTDGAEIDNLCVSGSIQGGGSTAAIAAVAVNSKFIRCVNAADLTGGNHVGGIAAAATNCTFENCSNLGSVSGASDVGGVAGTVTGGTLTACFNSARVTGSGTGTGGVLGTAVTAVTLSGCYNGAGGTVTGTGANTGGVAGSLALAFRAEDCSNRGTVTGAASTGGVAGLTGNASADAPAVITGCFNEGTVTGAAGVGGVAGKTGNYLDLDACENRGTVTGSNYTGGILGQGGTCTNLTGCHNDGTVRGTGMYTGGVVSYLGSSAWLDRCYNGESGQVSGSGSYTGGVAGYTSGMRAPVTGLYNAGQVTGSGTNTGGVVGNLGVSGQPMTGFYNAGTVTGGGTYTGGVFGQIAAGANSNVSDCYNTGSVSGSGGYVGGIAGIVSGSYSYMTGKSESILTRCWNLGAVTGTGAATVAGGICGMSSQNYAYAVDCFSFGPVTAQSEDLAAGISGAGYSTNRNCYYMLEAVRTASGEVVSAARDSGYSAGKSAAAFASGEVAYLLDKGSTGERTTLWGQGGSYPVPADQNHPAIYLLTLSVDGPEDGFAQPERPEAEEGEDQPEETPEVSVNGLTVGNETAGAETPILLYLPGGSTVEAVYTLKDGYLLERITTAPPACTAVLDGETNTITFTTPADTDGVAAVLFAQRPAGGGSTSCTVTFDANGGTWGDGSVVRTDTVSAGGRVPQPEAPAQDGGLLSKITFTGWYTDQECTEAYNFTSAVRTDLTLYAGWRTTGRHTVTFDAGEGTFGGDSTQTVIVTSGEKTAPAATPTREGCTFRGWFTNPEGTLAYDFTRPVTSDLTLYAGWNREGQFVVLFDANGGVVYTEDGAEVKLLAVTVNSGETLTAPSAYRAPAGSTTYELDGWETAGGALWSFGDPVTENMTLTARWTDTPFSNQGEDGTYEISDLATLEALRDAVAANPNFGADKTFVLTADLELPADWTSIGEYLKSMTSIRQSGFTGTFDGNGHTITLHPNQRQPLFGAVSGTIRNLNIKGTAYYAPVGVAYSTKNGTFENCTVEAKLYSAYAGILYYAYTGATIRGCTIKAGSVIVNNGIAAGILAVGTSSGTQIIEDCVVEDGVSITGSGDVVSAVGGVGGILADGCAQITRCYSGADLTATAPNAYVGGMAAHGNSMGNTVVTSCGVTGTFTLRAGGTVGGIVGSGNSQGVGKPFVTNCFFYGTITGGTVGGLVGNEVKLDSLDGYYCLKNGAAPSVANAGAEALPAADFASGRAAYLLDGGEGAHRGIWTQDEVNGHPALGTPSYYPAQVSAENGTISIGGRTSDLYLGGGRTIQITATPDEYENTEDGPQYVYVLVSLTVNGEEQEELTSFVMPEDRAEIVAVFAPQEIEPEEPETPEEPDPEEPAPEEPDPSETDTPEERPSAGVGTDGSGSKAETSAGSVKDDGDGAGTDGSDGMGDGGSETGDGAYVSDGDGAGNEDGAGAADSSGAGGSGAAGGDPAQEANRQAEASVEPVQSQPSEPLVELMEEPAPLTELPELEPEQVEEELGAEPETPLAPIPETQPEDDNLLEQAAEIAGVQQQNILPVVILIAVVAAAALAGLSVLLKKRKLA